ncbi:MAG: glycosyltransferase family 4 protein [Desulfovibrio sp.]|jgi:glycosyltransferase involved in cell wall biosynthesis|nr:glycosyltransferase family 4 protein [Desulfovibrio sp.]
MKIIVLGNQAQALVNFWSVLIRRMRAGGHEVVCCAPPGDAQADAALTASGTPVLHYRLDRKGLNPLQDARTFVDLSRLFRAEKPDVLFASTIKPVIYGCMAARLARVPHIYATITGLGYAFEADSFFKKCVNILSALLYRTALNGAEGVFFQNPDDITVFRRQHILKQDARALTARGVGVDTARFAPAPLPPGPPVFLLVARLLEAKGLAEYAEAARMLKKRHPAARFQVLGPPEQGLGSVSLERVRDWEAQGGIEYLGQTRDVRPYMAAAHVLVLPSWREGTPTAIMEAMSMGRPAVVTNAPGCREVVRDKVNGRLVPVRDAQALAAAMESYILDPVSIARMGAAGRDLAVAEFDAMKVADRILADMRISANSGEAR